MAFEEIDDFGFSSYDLEDLTTESELEEQIATLTSQVERESLRSQQIYDKMQVFIDNLIAADKDYIYWPVETRRTKMEQFRLELQGILQAD